jgi:hypothetical protein
MAFGSLFTGLPVFYNINGQNTEHSSELLLHATKYK